MRITNFTNADGGTTSVLDPFALPTDKNAPRTERRIKLTQKTNAFALDPNTGALNPIGGFNGQRLLKLDLTNPLIANGVPHFKVKNVRHENVWVPISQANADPLKASDIQKHVDNVMGSGRIGDGFDNKKMQEDLTNNAVQSLNNYFEAPKDFSAGLDVYHNENAFKGGADPILDPFQMKGKDNKKGKKPVKAVATSNAEGEDLRGTYTANHRTGIWRIFSDDSIKAEGWIEIGEQFVVIGQGRTAKQIKYLAVDGKNGRKGYITENTLRLATKTSDSTSFSNDLGGEQRFQINQSAGPMLQWFANQGATKRDGSQYNVGDEVRGTINENGNLDFKAFNQKGAFNTSWSANYFTPIDGGGYMPVQQPYNGEVNYSENYGQTATPNYGNYGNYGAGYNNLPVPPVPPVGDPNYGRRRDDGIRRDDRRYSYAEGESWGMKAFKFAFPFYGLFDRFRGNRENNRPNVGVDMPPVGLPILPVPPTQTPIAPVVSNPIAPLINAVQPPVEQPVYQPPVINEYVNNYQQPQFPPYQPPVQQPNYQPPVAYTTQNFAIGENLPQNEMAVVLALNNPILKYRQQGVGIQQSLQSAWADLMREQKRRGLRDAGDTHRRNREILMKWLRDSDQNITGQILPDSYYSKQLPF